MELYIHLPFCRSKCRYCDFPSYTGCEALMPDYVDALLLEAWTESRRCAAMPQGSRKIETVFIGGGTPSLLPAPLLSRLLGGLRDAFPLAEQAEFTTEANPGTLSAAWLETAISHGVNRLSMGMQAYQPHLLRTLGRIHDFSQVEASVQLARAAGLSNISLDLMFGLPGQTADDWRESLRHALSLAPTHLSCYGLIPEEGTPLTADLDAGRLCLPDEDEERRMYDDTLRILADHGYEQYEISNFALPGYACRHNLGYWRQIPYLGLGASAASCLVTGGDCAYTRSSNPPGLNEYLHMMRSGDFSARSVEAISHEDARYETLMLGLRTTSGVSEADYLRLHGCPIDEHYGVRLRALRDRGLLTHQDACWRLTRRGMDVQNAVLVELMDE